ncbi:MAG: gamma carbonic anhydrase family protein [Firmicutes bacterium]|nr:gamma carbonic anhydrase family protein [Bacillota bacterium]
MLGSFKGKSPRITQPSLVTETAVVVGDVSIGPRCSIWYGAVLRGDISSITIGEGTSVQENAVIHVDPDYPSRIGDDVTIGHLAMLHSCTVGSRTIVGMGSVILGGAEIGEECIIGAGAVVAPGTKIPPRSMVLGVPARVVRQLSDSEANGLIAHANDYWELAQAYLGK